MMLCRVKIYNNILTEKETEQLIDYGKNGKVTQGKVGDSVNKERKIRYDIYMRDRVVINSIDKMIYQKMSRCVNEDFNLDWKYREEWKMGYYAGNEKGFYDQHRDTYGDKDYRKITVIVALSNPEEYEGGELYFSELNDKYKLNKGDVIIFRSEEMHGVEPVISGKRKVLISFGFDEEGIKKKYENTKIEREIYNRYIPAL